jgi:hypothetical protein
MATSTPKYRYNPKPRLSANQLSDYLSASSTRRKRIIQDAKFPRTILVARYGAARDVIGNYLCDIARPTGKLVDGISALKAESEKTDSQWTKQDSLLSIEAIEAFHSAYTKNQMGVRKIECRSIIGNTQPHLLIEGTKVSVSLNATTHMKDKDGTQRVGGLVLLFSKSETELAARAERCRNAAVLAYFFALNFLDYAGKADPKLCFALDVFGGKAYPAPNAYKQRLGQINTSCEEIAVRWPTVKPPSDYDGPPTK